MPEKSAKYIKHNSVIKKRLGLISVIILLFGLVALGTLIYYHKTHQHRILPETDKNSMTKIPADIKKNIKEKQTTASISATLSVPILMYHYVEYVQNKRDHERVLLNVNPDIFEKQIQTLQGAGYTFITVKDLGDVLDGKTQLPSNPIILTFDDGHWDLDTNVVPILKKYNVKATAYIVPGFIGTNTDSLSQKQMQDVVDSGMVEIAAHTVHHMYLKGAPLAKVKDEIYQSKSMLEQQYHVHVYSFAYPYGAFDQQALDVAKDAGFTTAASTIPGEKQNEINRFFLYRIRPGNQTGQPLLNYIKYWDTVPVKLSYSFPPDKGTKLPRSLP